MTLAELITACRSRADDMAVPYLWSDAEFTEWLHEAECEAAERALLLFDDQDESVCDITTEIGVMRYPLHESVFDVKKAVLIGTDLRKILDIVARDTMNAENPDWEGDDALIPSSVIVDEQYIYLHPKPDAEYTVHLSTFRLPLDAMKKNGDEPEIHQRHHARLIDWALHRAYSKHDADASDAKKAADYEAKFERSFGKRHDANVMRKRRHPPGTVKAIDF